MFWAIIQHQQRQDAKLNKDDVIHGKTLDNYPLTMSWVLPLGFGFVCHLREGVVNYSSPWRLLVWAVFLFFGCFLKQNSLPPHPPSWEEKRIVGRDLYWRFHSITELDTFLTGWMVLFCLVLIVWLQVWKFSLYCKESVAIPSKLSDLWEKGNNHLGYLKSYTRVNILVHTDCRIPALLH